MSNQLIQKYYAEIDKVIRYGASRNESSHRKPFGIYRNIMRAPKIPQMVDDENGQFISVCPFSFAV